MGTCMSKDKKGATSAAQTACASSSSGSSLSSQGRHLRPLRQNSEQEVGAGIPSIAEETLLSNISRPSSGDEGKESKSTDKHVVEIRLPVVSPSKFKSSPSSETIAARAVAAIARPAAEERACEQSRDEENSDEEEEGDEEEEEEEEEGGPYCDSKSPLKPKHPSPPIFYPSYLTRTSFSRDLAAFSRDIASLSSSPLMRSPSVNGAHDLIAAAIKAAHSPHYAHAQPHSNWTFDDYSDTTRSRSLPKRFYGKDRNSNLPPLHKRSTSRDAALEHWKPGKKKPMVDPPPPCEPALSPRISVRREEASGEYRVCARQAAARTGQHQHAAQLASSKTPDFGQAWKKERSPLRGSATGKVADADQLNHEFSQYQENQNFTQTINSNATILNKSRARPALRERSSNCGNWADATQQGIQGSCKSLSKGAKAKAKAGKCASNNEHFEECLQSQATQLELPNSSLYYSGKLQGSSGGDSDTMSATVDRVRSIIQALADLNMESSLFSEIEESETEVEGELGLLQFAFDPGFSPRRERHAQQARKMLLKEAAMDAFARPSFHSNMHPESLDEAPQQPPSDLAALMSTRLNEAEVDTLKIRKVLKLLSIAESEMGKEQKTLFYNQLRMVLDSVKTHSLADKNTQTGIIPAGDTKEKAVTVRANSWPRTMKEPTHIVLSDNLQEGSTPQVTHATQVLPAVIQPQEDLSLKPPESVPLAMKDWESDNLDDSVQKAHGGLDFSRLLSEEYNLPREPSSEFLHVHQDNRDVLYKVDGVDLAHESAGSQVLIEKPSGDSEFGRLMSAETNCLSGGSSANSCAYPANKDALHGVDACKIVDLACISEGPRLSVHSGELRTESCSAHRMNEHILPKKVESPTVDLDSACESPVVRGLVRDGMCGEETAGKLECQVLDGMADFLAKAIYGGGDRSDDVDQAIYTLSHHIAVEETPLNTEVLDQPQSSCSVLVKEACLEVDQVDHSAGMGCAHAGEAAPSSSIQGLGVSSVKDLRREICPLESAHYEEASISTFLSSKMAHRSDDVTSEGSFEFRVRSSTASTPISTPSTPMISTASTPRHLPHLDPPLTAREVAEIWEAFE